MKKLLQSLLLLTVLTITPVAIISITADDQQSADGISKEDTETNGTLAVPGGNGGGGGS